MADAGAGTRSSPQEPEGDDGAALEWPGPDVIIIGAQRCGTTSLYGHLLQHPLVLGASRKELQYFTLHHRRSWAWYRRQWPSHVPPGAQLCEATPYYLFHPWAARRVAERAPRAKVIALLRDPVDRAVSHYALTRSRGVEPLASFEQALAAEPGRLAGERERLVADPDAASDAFKRWSYATRGRYVEQLREWLAVIPRERLLVVRSEDLFDDPGTMFRQVTDFLGLPPTSLADRAPRNRLQYPPVNPTTRARLAEEFGPWNRELEELLGRPLGWDDERRFVTAETCRPMVGPSGVQRTVTSGREEPTSRARVGQLRATCQTGIPDWIGRPERQDRPGPGDSEGFVRDAGSSANDGPATHDAAEVRSTGSGRPDPGRVDRSAASAPGGRQEHFDCCVYVEPDLRFVHFAIHKAASTLVRARLIEWLAASRGLDPPHPWRHGREEPAVFLTPGSYGLGAFADALADPAWRKSTVVRDPFSRLLSLYLHLGHRVSSDVRMTPYVVEQLVRMGLDGHRWPTFDECARAICAQPDRDADIHWRSQVDLLPLSVARLTFVGRYERLDEDFWALGRHLLGDPGFGSPESGIRTQPGPPRTGASERLMEHYTPELADLVARRYEQDFAQLGYPPHIPGLAPRPIAVSWEGSGPVSVAGAAAGEHVRDGGGDLTGAGGAGGEDARRADADVWPPRPEEPRPGGASGSQGPPMIAAPGARRKRRGAPGEDCDALRAGESRDDAVAAAIAAILDALQSAPGPEAAALAEAGRKAFDRGPSRGQVAFLSCLVDRLDPGLAVEVGTGRATAALLGAGTGRHRVISLSSDRSAIRTARKLVRKRLPRGEARIAFARIQQERRSGGDGPVSGVDLERLCEGVPIDLVLVNEPGNRTGGRLRALPEIARVARPGTVAVFPGLGGKPRREAVAAWRRRLGNAVVLLRLPVGKRGLAVAVFRAGACAQGRED